VTVCVLQYLHNVGILTSHYIDNRPYSNETNHAVVAEAIGSSYRQYIKMTVLLVLLSTDIYTGLCMYAEAAVSRSVHTRDSTRLFPKVIGDDRGFGDNQDHGSRSSRPKNRSQVSWVALPPNTTLLTTQPEIIDDRD
jgi:hypothetical protein